MATKTKKKVVRKNTSKLDTFLDIFGILFPLVLSAIDNSKDENPSIVSVKSEKGKGNISVTHVSPDGKFSVDELKVN